MSHHFLQLFSAFASEMQLTEAVIFNFPDVLMIALTLKNFNKNKDWQTVGFKLCSMPGSTVLSPEISFSPVHT